MSIQPDNEILNTDWLTSFVAKLPEVPTRRKNFIEIAGYPSWENVNSNILAFYFDEKEEHAFKRLFLISLIELIKKKDEAVDLSLYEGSFKIAREFMANDQKRIDLLITSNGAETEEEYEHTPTESSSWAIIIENKIYASLYNDLKLYWDSIQADHKIGVVLSPRPVKLAKKHRSEECYFLSITHAELIAQVQKNLQNFFLDADDRHLLLLKEFIANIEALLPNPQKEIAMNKTLKLFNENHALIRRLKQTDKELLKHIYKSVERAMNEIGYSPKGTGSSGHQHFMFSENSIFSKKLSPEQAKVLGKFRFYIHQSEIRFSNPFPVYFELYGTENIKDGADLLKSLKNPNLVQPDNTETPGSKGSAYYHILILEVSIDTNSSTSLKEQIEDALNNTFIKGGVFNQCLDFYGQPGITESPSEDTKDQPA